MAFHICLFLGRHHCPVFLPFGSWHRLNRINRMRINNYGKRTRKSNFDVLVLQLLARVISLHSVVDVASHIVVAKSCIFFIFTHCE